MCRVIGERESSYAGRKMENERVVGMRGQRNGKKDEDSERGGGGIDQSGRVEFAKMEE